MPESGHEKFTPPVTFDQARSYDIGNPAKSFFELTGIIDAGTNVMVPPDVSHHLGEVLNSLTGSDSLPITTEVSLAREVSLAALTGQTASIREVLPHASDEWIAGQMALFGKHIVIVAGHMGGMVNLRNEIAIGMQEAAERSAATSAVSTTRHKETITVQAITPSSQSSLKSPVTVSRLADEKLDSESNEQADDMPYEKPLETIENDDPDTEYADPSNENVNWDPWDELVPYPDLVKVYLGELRRFSVLEADQEVELAKRMEAGLIAEKIVAIGQAITTDTIKGDQEQKALTACKNKLIEEAYLALHKTIHTGDDIEAFNEDKDIAARQSVDQLVELAKTHLEKIDDKRLLFDREYKAELQEIIDTGVEAKHTFAEHNLRLVVSLAKKTKYRDRGLLQLDLIQEGNKGLMKALGMFDYTKGNKFSTYGTWWIEEAIRRGIDNYGTAIRRPLNIIPKINMIHRTLVELETARKSATLVNVAAELGWDIETVHELYRADLTPISLFLPLNTSNIEFTLIDKLPSEAERVEGDAMNEIDNIFSEELSSELFAEAEKVLTDREMFCVLRRYGPLNERLGHEQIGEQIGVSREVSRKLLQVATIKLLHPRSPTSTLLLNFLDTSDVTDNDFSEAQCASLSLEDLFPVTKLSRQKVSAICGGCALTETCLYQGLLAGELITPHIQRGIFGNTRPMERTEMLTNRSHMRQEAMKRSPLGKVLAAAGARVELSK
jgi:RNA polymerase primary sigma factor